MYSKSHILIEIYVYLNAEMKYQKTLFVLLLRQIRNYLHKNSLVMSCFLDDDESALMIKLIFKFRELFFMAQIHKFQMKNRASCICEV